MWPCLSTAISGVVVERSASVGGLASEGAPLFQIADLSQLWVDLHIFGADAQHIQPGVPVAVTRMSDGETVHTTLERVLPGMATASQSTVARATIDNADNQWRPGTAVKARITVAQQPVAPDGQQLSIEDRAPHRSGTVRHRSLVQPLLAELTEALGLFQAALLALFFNCG